MHSKLWSCWMSNREWHNSNALPLVRCGLILRVELSPGAVHKWVCPGGTSCSWVHQQSLKCLTAWPNNYLFNSSVKHSGYSHQPINLVILTSRTSIILLNCWQRSGNVSSQWIQYLEVMSMNLARYSYLISLFIELEQQEIDLSFLT